ncbi:MAG: hypothetical protein C0469_10860, partial [Cyanobacteria bacterium DS2.3.42]|nr:hypothetical protein [Cyanobacteria bacterium DS2.3.42]
KAAGADAWDSRVETGVKAYEVNSKYTSSQDNLPVLIEVADGYSFIEMDRPEDAPAIESYDGGHVKMIPTFDNQGAGIRRLSSMRNSFKMLECRESEQSLKAVDPSNSYDSFNSFVSYKSTDSSAPQETLRESVEEMTVDTAEALVIIEELLQEMEIEQESCEPVQQGFEEIHATCEKVQQDIVEALEESFDDLLAECFEGAKTYEDFTDHFENASGLNKSFISFAPETLDQSIVEDYAGNFSVTFADSLSEMSDIARVYDQMNFDPKSFVSQTIDGEPIEAVCVFDSEKLSFSAPETIRTELESMFNMDPLSQVDEETSEIEIENVTVVSIEDAETLEVAAVGGKPSRQRTKGTSRSKKTQTRKEKKSKKRAAAPTV